MKTWQRLFYVATGVFLTIAAQKMWNHDYAFIPAVVCGLITLIGALELDKVV